MAGESVSAFVPHPLSRAMESERSSVLAQSHDQHLQQGGLFGTPGGLLVDDLAMGEDGRIVGYVGDTALALHADGRVERSPQAFRFLRNSGALALAGSYLVATLAGSAACFVLGVFAVQLIWRA